MIPPTSTGVFGSRRRCCSSAIGALSSSAKRRHLRRRRSAQASARPGGASRSAHNRFTDRGTRDHAEEPGAARSVPQVEALKASSRICAAPSRSAAQRESTQTPARSVRRSRHADAQDGDRAAAGSRRCRRCSRACNRSAPASTVRAAGCRRRRRASSPVSARRLRCARTADGSPPRPGAPAVRCRGCRCQTRVHTALDPFK